VYTTDFIRDDDLILRFVVVSVASLTANLFLLL